MFGVIAADAEKPRRRRGYDGGGSKERDVVRQRPGRQNAKTPKGMFRKPAKSALKDDLKSNLASFFVKIENEDSVRRIRHGATGFWPAQCISSAMVKFSDDEVTVLAG